MPKTAIIVSGLPASGKTTVGRSIAASLELDFIDKDDILERLFAQHGIGDHTWRRRLSVESDEIFQRQAAQSDGVVLVSHWRPRGGPDTTGTPTGWIDAAFDSVIEVNCRCSPAIAASRFIARKRHPGHLDEARDPHAIGRWMHDLAAGYPLGLGRLVPVETGAAQDPSDPIAELKVTLRSQEH